MSIQFVVVSRLLSDLSMLVCIVIAGLDFLIFNGFIFPSPIVRGATSPSGASPEATIEESEAIEASVKKGTEDAEVDLEAQFKRSV